MIRLIVIYSNIARDIQGKEVLLYFSALAL